MKRIITLLLLITFYNINAQSTKGNLAGKIIDKATNEEIIGATVAVEGTSTGATTDLDGKFFLKLDPGTYTIVVSYVSYKTKKYEGIEIKAGELTPLNVGLDENSTELEEVVVQGEARKESAAGLLLQQKNAVAVSSGISADLIRKMPDRTTADVIKRVSGTSIQDGKFAIIRGLGDRYNYGMINGAPLPSSESDRKAFSLDIVPAQVVDNIIISKTATPDMPGDFAGGLIQINTRDIPDENVRFITLGLRGHSLTTFQDFNQSPDKSSTDWLGFDNGNREIPTNALSTKDAQALNSLNPTDAQQLTSQTNLFHNNFAPTKTTALPNAAFQAGLSQRFKLFNNDFGVMAAVTYNAAQRNVPGSIVSFPVIASDATSTADVSQAKFYNNVNNSRSSVNLGGILNLSYKIGSNSKFFLKNLITQNAEDQTYERDGLGTLKSFQSVDTLKLKDYSYMYTSNRMISSQLGGEHFLPASKIKIHYTVGYNNLYRNVPDFKRLFYQQPATVSYTDPTFNPSGYNPSLAILQQNPQTYTPQSSGSFYSKMNEFSGSANYDASMPFFLAVKHEIKIGGFHQIRSRDFNARNYLYGYTGTQPSDSITGAGPDQIFGAPNIGADKIFQRESTQGSDAYTASSSLNAGFLMLESKFTPQFRAIYGVRVESFHQKVSSVNLGSASKVDTTWNDILPSVNLIYGVTDKMNLRASYSRTVSRPEFREFALLAFYEFSTNSIVIGNPKLTRANIDNFDAKWEFFPSPGSTFSINPFVKLFKNPIEFVNQGGQSGLNSFSYSNANSAQNLGVEFETRFKFDFIPSAITKDMTFFANLALIYSKVNVSNISRYATSDFNNRPLQGQSPYVFNAGLQYSNDKSGWDFTISANQVGRRIAYVGDSKRLTIWENPRLVLDASITKTIKKWQLRAIVGDLLAQNLVFYYDLNGSGGYEDGKDLIAFKYRNGQSFTLQANLNF